MTAVTERKTARRSHAAISRPSTWRGSTFTVDLPLAFVDGPAEAQMSTARGIAAVGPPKDQGGSPQVRILAAEDNRTNQVLLAAMLSPLGVELQMAADGLEAVERFRDGRFDLVLMDIQMPVMNGVEATRTIRALEQAQGRAPTPILALSANAMRHQIEEYLAAGMDGFVAKPIDMTTLLGAVQAALAGAPREAVL